MAATGRRDVAPLERRRANLGAIADPAASRRFRAAPAPPPPGQGLATPYPITPVANVRIPTYLVWAILVTLLCFLPTGIVAIVYASQVTSKLQAGDVAGATDASNKAKMWTIISAVAGIVLAIALVAGSVGTSSTPSFT